MDRPDLAWKLLLRRRLPQVLARLFPDVHGSIDWPRGYGLPDNNIPPVTADSRTGDRAVDFIAIVSLLDGKNLRACGNPMLSPGRFRGPHGALPRTLA